MQDEFYKVVYLLLLLIITVTLIVICWTVCSAQKSISKVMTSNYTNPSYQLISSQFVDGEVNKKLRVLQDNPHPSSDELTGPDQHLNFE